MTQGFHDPFLLKQIQMLLIDFDIFLPAADQKTIPYGKYWENSNILISQAALRGNKWLRLTANTWTD